ncbi:MAG: YrhK family protein [Solirubrobacterales bacterium]|nr:YrhK family protein [Solirubrobacterales bacterium]
MSAEARKANTAIGILFAIGSACFLIGPFPGYLQLVGSSADGLTFFIGSVFFTSAAFLQFATTRLVGGAGADWWAGGIQFAGTLFFNLSTWEAMQKALDTKATDRLVWQPDVYGSICFLVSSWIAYGAANGGYGRRRRHDTPARIAFVNLLGSIAFGVSAVASYVVPATGDVLALGASNFTTAFGAGCFLAGAILLLPAVSSRRPS